MDSWIVGGDFNEICFDNEKQGGRACSFSTLNTFHSSLQQLDLYDVKSSGPTFTWNNMRSGDQNILARLDRFVANSSWLTTFPDASFVNLDYYGSDHRPILLKTHKVDQNTPAPIYSSFKFEHKWIYEEEYKEIVYKG